MIRYAILPLFLFCFISPSYSQSDTLNQLDSNGKKTGWHMAFMDENLRVLKDSIGATHCMYNYYCKDIFLYRFGEGYGTKKYPIIYPENDTLSMGNYTLINGRYITKYKSGNLRSELIARNGYMTGFKFYYPNGQLKFEVIVSESCGAPAQHCIRQYRKDGRMKFDGHTWLPKEK